MRRLFIIGIYILTIQFLSSAQIDSISLLECLSEAKQHAAVKDQYEVFSEMAKLRIANATASYLPSLSAFGKAWYQSDAITVENQYGPVIEVDQFQYNTGIEAIQKIYDGGITKRKKDLEMTTLSAENEKIEVELYQLNSTITDLFYNSILLNNQVEIIQLKTEVINKRSIEMESAFKQGIIKRNDLEKIRAEFLSTQQQLTQLAKLREQIIISLSVYTGLNIDPTTIFIVTDTLPVTSKTIRPEYRYFDAEVQRLENLTKMQQAKNLPILAAYGQAGYSYPGLNFFENKPDYYYIAGARLSWTLFDWKQNKRETQVLLSQRELIETKKTDFERTITMSLEKELIEQKKLKEIIKMDEELITQLKAITKGSESALLNGVITSTDYLEDLNAEIKARLDWEAHKVELQKSYIKYLLLEGIDLKTY